MRCVYGPVPSWRLGLSLGIDPVGPPKTCTFDCVYCQLGRTVHKIGGIGEFKPRVSIEKVLGDLEEALSTVNLRRVRYVTFSGLGEPTLHPQLAEMVEEARKLTGKPIAILTNSSLITDERVLRALLRFDLVVAKLDAADQRLFEAVNRPAKGLRIERIVEGIGRLKRRMEGRLAIQSMFFHGPGFSNFSAEAVEALAKTVSRLEPDEVQVNTPTRPPAEPGVFPLTSRELQRVAEAFRERLPSARVISRVAPRLARPSKLRKPSKQEVLEVLKRRPCGVRELSTVLNTDVEGVSRILGRLRAEGLIVEKKVGRRVYFRVKV